MPKVTIRYENTTLQEFDFPVSKLGFSTNVRYVSFFASIDRFLDEGKKFEIGANVRDPGDTKATKDMIETLTSPERLKFWGFNSGLILIAKDWEHKKSKKEVVLDIPDNFGLLNGGHTQYAIHKALKQLTEEPHPLVRIEVLVGEFTDDEISEIAKARNTTQNVGESQIWNKQKKLEPIKATLGSALSRMVKWRGKDDKEADEGAVDVDNFLHWIMLIEETSNVSGHWKNTFISKGKGEAAKGYIRLKDAGKSRHLELVAKEVAILRDNIKSGFAFEKGNSGKLQSGIGKVTMNTNVIFKEKKNAVKMPFSKEESLRPVPDDAYILPIIAAFGTMLDKKKTHVKWKFDPNELWADQTLRKTLVMRVKPVIMDEKSASKVKNNKHMFELLCQDIIQFQQKHAKKKGIPVGPEYKIS